MLFSWKDRSCIPQKPCHLSLCQDEFSKWCFPRIWSRCLNITSRVQVLGRETAKRPWVEEDIGYLLGTFKCQDPTLTMVWQTTVWIQLQICSASLNRASQNVIRKSKLRLGFHLLWEFNLPRLRRITQSITHWFLLTPEATYRTAVVGEAMPKVTELSLFRWRST